MIGSWPAASARLPSDEKATRSRRSELFDDAVVNRHAPLAVFQCAIDPSAWPVRMELESDDWAMQVMSAAAGPIVRMVLPLSSDHTSIERRSLLLETTKWP